MSTDEGSVLRLVLDRTDLAICRLLPSDSVPSWATGAGFLSVTRTAAELSVVCQSVRVPADVVASRGWVRFEVLGPLEFSLVGIIARLSGALAEAGVSVFVVSTFDTDHVLVRSDDAGPAAAALGATGCSVAEPTAPRPGTEER